MHATTLRFLCFLLLVLPLPAVRLAAQAPYDPAAKAAAIAPFLDEQTIAVGRLDLTKLDAAAAVKLLGEIAPDKSPELTRQLAAMEQQGQAMLSALKQAGISELYAVVSLADVPAQPPFVVAPVKAGGDAQKAAEALRGLLRPAAVDVRDGAAVAASPATIDRLKTLRPTPRPEIAKGFERAGGAAVQVVFSPSDDTRRVLREMLPRLPDEIGGGSGRQLADGIQWAVLSANLPPQLSLSLTVQSKDAESAAAVRALAVSGLALAREDKGVQKIPQLDEVIRTLTPRLAGDRLVVSIREADGSARTLLNVLVPAIQAARTAAGRSQSQNNLHQIGLAMHNYHDSYRGLPPQAIRSKDGRPLLSWRVAILPWLGEKPLFDQFRLDEPWDSEHNKKLIEKMPAVFASPHLGDARKAQGMTAYVVPLSRQPPAVFLPPSAVSPPPGAGPADAAPAPAGPEMVFDNPAGVTFLKITDGTSNTAIVVEAHPTAAVIWTKPDDLIIDSTNPFQGLRNQPSNAFAALFGDGSVRMISYNVEPKVLMYIFQMNDGQPHGF